MDIIDTLLKHPIFRGLALEEANRLILDSRNHKEVFSKDEFVRYRGDECSSLFFVVSGKVRAEMQDPKGIVLLLEIMGFPALLAPNFMFAQNGKFPVNVVAVEDTAVWIMHRDVVVSGFYEYPAFLMNFLRIVGDKTDFLTQKLWISTMNTLKEKVIAYLYNLTEYGKKSAFELPIMREEMANLFGVERPSLSRVVSELNKEGLIEIKGRKARIIDFERIKTLLEM
ncbi:MAG: Crp/Fnr family transcriptional regulator [Synergistetes bacterium]|nr:Crp/Fnr family transcriptional regulator [Synergistota bacterium]